MSILSDKLYEECSDPECNREVSVYSNDLKLCTDHWYYYRYVVDYRKQVDDRVKNESN